MDNKENPSAEGIPEVVEAGAQEVVKQDPLAKGRERMAAIGGFFTKVKEKAVSITSRVGGGISRFFSRSSKVLGTGAAAVLSGDVLAKQGAQWTGEKYGELVENVDKGLDKAEAWTSEKIDKAEGWMSEKAEKAGEYVGEKYAQGKEWAGEVMDAGAEKYKQFEDLCAAGAQNVDDFVEKSAKWFENKKEQAKTIVNEGIEVAKDVAFAVETKTVESIKAAKEGIKKQYNSVVEYGEKALANGKVRLANANKKFWDTLNAWRVARLDARIERDMQARDRLLELKKNTENNKQLMSDVDQIEAAA